MWRAVYNKQGRQIENDDVFFKALRSDYVVTSMVELLDTDFRSVEGGTIFSADQEDEITNFISDGSIDVDTTRGTRRTSELTLLNPTADFTPSMRNDDWDGKLYLNRMVRIWRGLYYAGQPLYIPVGTFLVDNIDVIVEQNMSLVNLTMSDRWKMIQKSFYGANRKYLKNTLYTDIISDMLQAAQINLNGRFGAVIDNLHGRDPDDRRTNVNIVFKTGDSRGEKLKEMCDRWDIDAYFDPMGIFRAEDRRDARDKNTVWTFKSSPIDEDGHNGGLVSLTRSFNDDNLYNHVIVVGTGGQDGERKKRTIRATRENNNPFSVTNIDRIGDRVYLFQSDKISTQNEANRALNRAWRLRFQLSESIEAKVISNPALEGDDVVRIVETEHAKLDDTYRLQRFDVPLVSSLQTITAVNIIRETD
jgi:hypothetical protein